MSNVSDKKSKDFFRCVLSPDPALRRDPCRVDIGYRVDVGFRVNARNKGGGA